MDDGQFRAIVGGARDVVTVLDGAGVVQYENEAVERALGYAPDERTGDPLVEYVHEDDCRRVREALPVDAEGACADRERESGDEGDPASVVEGGPQFDWPGSSDSLADGIEYRVWTADEGWTWVESVGSMPADLDGVVLHTRAVTERKRRERELQRDSTLLDSIFERLPIHLFVKDAEARHVRLSDMLVDDYDSVIGKTDLETEKPTDPEAVRAAYEDDLRVLRTGEPILDEEEYYRDYDRWFLTSKIPRYGQDGSVVGILGSSRDVTPLKRRNEQLTLLNRIVRHDIRNDVGVITGWLEDLREESPPEHADALDDAVRASEHVLELTYVVGDLLEMIERDGEIDVYGVDLSSTLHSEVERARTSFESAEITVEEYPDVTVRANAMLSSVFGNLLNNAVQHNDAGDPWVGVSVEVGESAVAVRVADDGPGIPESQREELFGRGKKGLESEGTGIGLYLVDTLTEAFGGAVWIEGREPTGTVVAVRLDRIRRSVGSGDGDVAEPGEQ